MTENIFPLPCLTYFSPAVGFVPGPTTLCALVSTKRGTGSSVELVRFVTRPPFLNKIDKRLLAAENPREVHCWRKTAWDASKARHGQLDGGETIFQALISTCVHYCPRIFWELSARLLLGCTLRPTNSSQGLQQQLPPTQGSSHNITWRKKITTKRSSFLTFTFRPCPLFMVCLFSLSISLHLQAQSSPPIFTF